MYGPALLALVTAWASLAHGDAGWQTNQVNTRICQWQQLRAAVLRDTVYLDGGDLWWQPGFADGSAGQAVNDNNRLGLIYTLNFSIPFNTTQNISAILGTLSTGGGDTDNRAPNYLDGALLGNDDEFFLYGGLLQRTDSFSDPPGSTVLGYYGYQYGAAKAAFKSEFFNMELGGNMTRYVTYGGAASAPSENLAWYFSGFRSPSGGEIYTPGSAPNDSTIASVVSNTLITLNLATQQHETFSNVTLDPEIPGRANPELVWVPVGSRGILVALGGVVYPDFGNYTGASNNVTASEAQSPAFMSTINIYDVAGNKWYSQKTTGGPGQLTRGCAVVARAPDGSSFNIYYYGGYDGLHPKELFSDDVWVLSLPTFTWVKLASSTAEGRAGHKCVTPYPDQMLVIGGYPQLQGASLGCLKETIRVFNLSTGTWVDRYDPAVYSNYTVPTAVVEKIGSATSPVPSGWDSNDLASVFSTQYPVSKIVTYYPYPSVGPVNNTNPNVPLPSAQQDQGGSGLPSYLPPVLGVVLGLVFLTMVAVFILLWRRRRLLSGGTVSEVDTEDSNGLRIKSWLRGQPSEVKAPTVTTTSDYTPLSSTEVDSVGVPPQSIAEMMNTEVRLPAELPDTSPPAELQNTALPPSATAHSPSLNPATYYPTTHQTDHALITHTPSPIPSPSPYPSPPPIPHDDDDESPVYYRPDSDALGRAPTTSANTSPTGTTTTGMHTATTSPTNAGGSGGRASKVLSGVSNLSDRDRAHLRQISDTTVSSVNTAPGYHGGHAASGMAAVVADRGVVESPAAVSPPTATGEGPAGDYLSARPLQGLGLAQGLRQGQGQQGGGPSSPLRRSVFSEEMGDEESGSGESGRRG